MTSIALPLYPASVTQRLRKPLNHRAHFAGRFGAVYFVTICCDKRGINQLCHRDIAKIIFETASIYHRNQTWQVRLMLLMPDHLHTLVSVDGRDSLGEIIRSKESRQRWHVFNGSGTSLITAFGMMKAAQKSSVTSVPTQFEPDSLPNQTSGHFNLGLCNACPSSVNPRVQKAVQVNRPYHYPLTSSPTTLKERSAPDRRKSARLRCPRP